MKKLEIEVVFIHPCTFKEESFFGTAEQVMFEVEKKMMIYGSCEYYIPRKVAILTEVE